MDDRSFDSLARALGSGRSRRQIFKTLAGGALGAALTGAGFSAAGAAKLRSAGNVCAKNSDCTSGLCLPAGRGRAVCGCDSAGDCPASPSVCQTALCQVGVCGFTVTTGAPCDDGNLCTNNDVCLSTGVCAGTPVPCTPSDQCHVAGTCDPGTGACTNPPAPNDTPCDDGVACTGNDVCTNGVCAGTPVVCPAPTACQVSVACDATSGQCTAVNKLDGTLCGADNPCSHDVCQGGVCTANAPKPEGTACNDENSCTRLDACDGQGACIGDNPVTCPPSDLCHDAAVCNEQTGQCGANPVSAASCFISGVCYASGAANPDNQCQICAPETSQSAWSSKADATICSTGDNCITGETCQAGVCAGLPVICAEGSICLNGGCFQIAVPPPGQTECGSTCIGRAGSIIGTNLYICVKLAGGNCTTNADCAVGDACGDLCYAAC